MIDPEKDAKLIGGVPSRFPGPQWLNTYVSPTHILSYLAGVGATPFWRGTCTIKHIHVGARLTCLYETKYETVVKVLVFIEMITSVGFSGYQDSGNEGIGFLFNVILVEPAGSWDPNR